MKAASLFVALAVALPTVAGPAEPEPLLLEWAEHAKERDALAGDHIFQRSLFCTDRKVPMTCELTTVMIGRALKCPIQVEAMVDRTGETLQVKRAGKMLTLEVDQPFRTITLTVEYAGTRPEHVERASGVIVSKPIAGERARATELVAFVKETPGLSMREWVEVDLKCSRITVIAAKKPGR